MNLYEMIVKNCDQFRRFNALKFNRFQQLIVSENVKKIVNLVPALLSTNDSKVPGYVSGSVKFGVYGYKPDEEVAGYFKGRFGVNIPPVNNNPMVETLAVMGSVGTVAYNKKSDFDYWAVIDREKVNDNEYANFREKVDAIQKWAMKDAGVEVHIFVNDVTNLRKNIFDEDEDEGFGSTIGAVLKDEFFRSSIIVSGKIPFWWVIPKFLPDEEYFRLYNSIASREIGKEIVDIGNLFRISKEDFMGAALFQLIKAIGNPFKSILKIGILEKYLFRDNKSGLLSQKLKMSILRGQLGNFVPDSYLMMFNEVYKYYSEFIEDRELLNVLRQNLYLKIDPQLSKYEALRDNPKLPYKVAMMFKVVDLWGWDMAQIEDLDNFESWDYNRIVQFWNYVKKFMLLSYQKISKDLPNMDLKNKISKTDFQLLRGKIKANFSLEANKIENFITFKDTPYEPYLYVEPELSSSKAEKWRVYKKFRPQKGDEIEVNIKDEGELLHLLAWCSINQIYDPSFSRVYFESGYYHYNKNYVVELLNKIFEMFNGKKVHVKNEYYMEAPRTYKNMIILNFGESNADEINSFSHLYMNSWGESFLKQYKNMSDFVMVFSKVIKDGLFFSRDFDEFCFFYSPEPHRKIYKNIEKTFFNSFETLKNGKKNVLYSFIVAFGNEMVYVKKVNDDVKVMSFGNFLDLLGYLSLNSHSSHEISVISHSNTNLLVLEDILEKRSDVGFSFVYQNRDKYIIFYLMDMNGNLFTFIRKRIHDDLPVSISKFCRNILSKSGKAFQGGIPCYELVYDRFKKPNLKDCTKEIMQLDFLSTSVPGGIEIDVLLREDQNYYILRKNDSSIGPVPSSEFSETMKKLFHGTVMNMEVIDVVFKEERGKEVPPNLCDYVREKYKIEKLLGSAL